MDKNYDKDIYKLEARMENLEKRVDRNEAETNDKLSQIKKQIDDNNITTNNKLDKLFEKLDQLNSEASFSKGFIKAVLVSASILAFAITIIMKFIL